MVVERLRARRDEIVGAIFARVRGDSFGPVGADDAEYVAGLRAAVVVAVEYSLQGIEWGEDRAGPIPSVALEQARRAARVGVTLQTVLRRYVLGSALLEQFVLEEADRDERDGIRPTPRGASRGVLRTQAAALDRLLQAITAEYEDELQRMGRSPERRRYERVRRLLDGGAVEGRVAEDHAVEMAGLDYEIEDRWHLGMIAVGDRAERAVRELAAGIDRRLLSVAQGRESVWAWLGGRDGFTFVDVERATSGMVSSEAVVFAVGEPAWGLQGWRLTHQQAQAALVVALRRPRAFTRYADVALLASALKDEMLGGTLIEAYVAPLEDARGGGPVLRKTLRAYLAAERSVSSAASTLEVVRKTVENRLRMIEDRLGRTLHPCPAELEVALLLDEFTPTPVSALTQTQTSMPAPPEISTNGESVT